MLTRVLRLRAKMIWTSRQSFAVWFVVFFVTGTPRFTARGSRKKYFQVVAGTWVWALLVVRRGSGLAPQFFLSGVSAHLLMGGGGERSNDKQPFVRLGYFFP